VIVGVRARLGLGGALARRFAAEGFHVFIAGRNGPALAEVADEITAGGGGATPVVADATSESDMIALLDQAEAHGGDLGGGLGVMIYNAGNNFLKPLLDLTVEEMENVWRVSCLGGFICGREAVRRMLPRGVGTVLFTGATASIKGRPPFTAFASGKFALRAVAQSMAREFGPQGLHVGHVIIDGGIHGDKLLKYRPEMEEQRGPDGLLGVDDIAQSYWQLHCQPRSAWSFEIDLRPYKETF